MFDSKRMIRLAFASGALAALISGCIPSGNTGSAAPAQPATPAEQLARTKCTMCHTYDRVASAKKDAAGWQATIDRMVVNGLVVTPEEKQEILDYLTSQ